MNDHELLVGHSMFGFTAFKQPYHFTHKLLVKCIYVCLGDILLRLLLNWDRLPNLDGARVTVKEPRGKETIASEILFVKGCHIWTSDMHQNGFIYEYGIDKGSATSTYKLETIWYTYAQDSFDTSRQIPCGQRGNIVPHLPQKRQKATRNLSCIHVRNPEGGMSRIKSFLCTPITP